MITSKYIGRLGNNMFQLAASIGYARMYGYYWASEHKNEEVPGWFDFCPHLPKSNPSLNSYQCHDPKMFNYKCIPNQGANIRLVGFFQSEKYFKHCEDEVRQVFKLTRYDMEGFCSIHVRRGDYVKYAKDFPPSRVAYIQEAMRIMKSKHEWVKFMFFSDEIQWCKQNFPGHQYSEGNNEFEDLELMASCDHHIIANSTFSWWAAWLGKNPDRHIISPSHNQWFGPNNGVTKAIGSPKDIIPDHWQQLEV